MIFGLVADAAYPFEYSRLPVNVSVVAGYVGEHGWTPHVWSTQEVNALRATGRTWWAIIVPPQRALTAVDGSVAASSMINALPQYGYDKSLPVLLDIERGSWDKNPNGAKAAIMQWKHQMNSVGYAKAYAYVPLVAGFDWIAHWTNRAPTSLPANVVGQQFAGNVDGGRYDLSVFRAELFPAPPPPHLPLPSLPAPPVQRLDDPVIVRFPNAPNKDAQYLVTGGALLHLQPADEPTAHEIILIPDHANSAIYKLPMVAGTTDPR